MQEYKLEFQALPYMPGLDVSGSKVTSYFPRVSGRERAENVSEASTAPPEGTSAKILFLDIETSPNLAYVWSLKDNYVSHQGVVVPQELMCFSAKWFGQDEIMFFSSFHDGKEEMVRKAHELLDEADIVVHYYGKAHDIPHLNKEILLAGLTPPSPYKQVDLFLAIRRQFKFPSNKLDYVTKALGIPGKKKSIGYEGWIACLNNDPDAWEQMRLYNENDTKILEALYIKVLPWIPGHPNLSVFAENKTCPSCGSPKLQKRGYARTNAASYRRYQCQSCGRWCKGSKKKGGSEVREEPL